MTIETVTINGLEIVFSDSQVIEVVEIGTQGVPGIPGTPGLVGRDGVDGAQGIQGLPGSAVDKGDPGPMGPQGIQGVQGLPGADSTVAGPAGPAGADSTVPGPAGPQGIQGVPGNDSVIAGPQGNIGLTGPKGDTGAASTVAGPAGPQGIQGIPGDIGPTGSTGADSIIPGPQGIQGIQGIQGNIGNTGAASTVAGPQGIPGNDSIVPGPQGIQGIPGADSVVPGPQGIQGIQGAAGVNGNNVSILDEGITKTTAPNSIDFVGAGVTASNIGNAVTVTIPGGSGSVALAGVLSANADRIPFSDGTHLADLATFTLTGNGLNVAGSLNLTGTATVTTTTPVGSSVQTRLAIPSTTLPAFGQSVAMGTLVSSPASSRIISLFDARTVEHQPTIAVFNPAESDAIGLSWEGSDTRGYLKSLAGGLGIKIASTEVALFNTTGVSILGTLGVNGNTALSGVSTAPNAAADTNTTQIATTAFVEAATTPAQLLTDIKTVDGTGSGLDADTLDGLHGNSYATLTGAETLTNKILTNPTIALINSAAPRQHNDIINGQFRVAQLGTSFSAAVNAAYDLDGWLVSYTSSAVVTVAQATGSSAGRLARTDTVTAADTSIAAGDFFIDNTRIEGYNIVKYVGATFTVGFRAKVPVTGIHCVSLINNAGDRSYVHEINFPVANVWQDCAFTVVGGLPTAGTWDYINGLGLRVYFIHACGTTYQTATPDTWVTGLFFATANQVNDLATVGNVWALENVTINLGTQVAVNDISIEDEERRCQRYNPSWVTATNRGMLPNAFMINTTQASITFFFSIKPRTTPTGVGYSAANIININDTASTAITFGAAGDIGCQLNVTTAGGLITGMTNYTYLNTTGARLYFAGCRL